MPSPSSFSTYILRNHPKGEAVARILSAALDSVDPEKAIGRAVQRFDNRVLVGSTVYNLAAYQRIALLAIGKAGIGMARALAEILDSELDDMLVVAKHTPQPPEPEMTVITGGHPIPDHASLQAGAKVLAFVRGLTQNDLLFCLISGGGSALVTAPVEGITLESLQKLTTALLASGAPIDEINILRRSLDQIKGGGITRNANGAQVVSLILSDVIGNRLEAIASGPTVANPTTANDALAVLEQYGLAGDFPEIVRVLSVEQPAQAVKHSDALIIGSLVTAAQAALAQARVEGFNPYLMKVDMQGEARTAAFELATQLRWAANSNNPVSRPACIVAGGETTVTLCPPSMRGRGGRNTELALAAVSELAEYPNVMLVTLATDGEDGVTDAAGAVVSGDTWQRAKDIGLDVDDFLARNDSYRYFEPLDDLLKIGATGTNVNDLTFLFTF